MKIGFDIMGGDHAPANEIEGAILASTALPPSVKIILIGDSDKAKAYLKSKNLDENTFEIVHTTEVIDMGEHPTKALSLVTSWCQSESVTVTVTVVSGGPR